MSLDISIGDFDANITHNLNNIWSECGVYDVLYSYKFPDTKTGKELIPIIKKGLIHLIENKDKCVELEPSNGWGTYEHALPWLIEVYQACLQYPDEVFTSNG